ncbi:CaiB/BaiF CoA transferase family protein [Microbacterium sp. No. 7]|uniref:CaiB/BaiF CoA transferase family protein n=1 Tax=Microbacterium sp. No. 7 TaxID=1714373 RepID=UPI0006CF60FB|nr:CoA transferase [Microbacterium sp. No. 7]ALJ19263.1 acyl-CoA transferase [Microbacterium sp. No. 7]
MAELPLAGIIVVELGDSASAPFAGKVLTELGAEVWKVERPSGDSSRGWGPSVWKGTGASFHALNRGKKLIGVDIKDPEQLETLRTFIATKADVFIHNLRPGSAGKYGLDAESLRARNPRLVHAEVGAFGSRGPLSTLPGYDPLMQAFSGIMSITGEPDHPPARAGVSIVDFGTGMWSVIGILSALFQRGNAGTGVGAAVSASLLETAIAWMTIGIANYNADGDLGGRFGSGTAFIVPHRAYSTSDGDLIVSCANDTLFAQLAAALGHPEWAEDERFATNAGRIANRTVIDGLIGDVIATRTRAHWQETFGAAGIACAPIQTTDELVAHEQTAALGILGHVEDDEIDLVGLPLSFDGERPPALPGAGGIGAADDEFRERMQ